MTLIANEPRRVSDVVKFEEDAQYSRETRVIAQNAAQTDDLEIGQLMDGLVAEDTTGGDVDGVLLARVTAEDIVAGNVTVPVLVRHAVIDSDQVTIPAGIKVAALAALLALGIVSRTEPEYDIQNS